jgi:NAD(P)-dependent dehydrogenase (short-subunit alcohol dehydrogenase family)
VQGEQFGGGAVIVTIGRAGIGERLVQHLVGRGVDAVGVTTDAGDTRADLAALFLLATQGRALHAVVHASVGPASLQASPLHELDDDAWMVRGEDELTHALRVFQAAFDAFGPEPDEAPSRRIVAIVPNIAILGAPELVPLATTADGTRSLVKSAARQWGGNGITVNSIAIPCEALADGAPAGPVVAVPSLPPVEDPAADAADAVTALLGPAGAAMNGQTLIVDRGTVMV